MIRQFLLPMVATVCLVGCKEPDVQVDTPDESADTIVMDELPPMLDDVHGHSEHGPHGGELIELGKEAFHIEFVHGPDGVAFYVLDGAVAESVAIESKTLTVSLKNAGTVKSFQLAADPQADDGEGKSSRFVSLEPELVQTMNDEAEGAVVVQIQGKSYTGKIAHDHDHSGHDH
jgi:hypothetical protein